MRRTTAISLIAAAAIAGIALGRAGVTAPGWMIAATAVAALLTWRSRLLVLGLMLLALSLGLWRTEAWTAQRAELANLIGQKVTLTGAIADDPTVTEKGVDFKLAGLKQDGQPLPGEITVHLYRVQLQRGYQVQVTGTVKPGFGNAVAALSFPQLDVLSRSQDPLERLRQRFFTGIKTALPEPIASFGLGLLVGIRALIPKDMQAQLTLVGLSHLVAVSGYNLTIIVQATHRLLERFGRGIALATSLWLIGGFLIVTGASASIVRASLVAVLSLLAAFYGRRFNPITLIFVAAGITAVAEPKYLTDLGWLLSFLAFFGILVLAPAVEARLGHPKPVLARLFIESCAAHVLTVPLILFMFGNLSIVAPITNLVVLPLIPLAMAVSFAAGLAGLLIPAFAGWIAWPAALLLGLITMAINQFAALPWAGRTDHITWPVMLMMYALIVTFVVIIQRANRRLGRKSPEDRRATEIAVA